MKLYKNLVFVLLLILLISGVSTIAGAQPMPSDGGNLYYKGMSHFEKGEYVEALHSLERAVPLLRKPERIFNARKMMAVIFENRNDHKRAVDQFKRILKQNHNYDVEIQTVSPQVYKALEEAREIMVQEKVIASKEQKELENLKTKEKEIEEAIEELSEKEKLEFLMKKAEEFFNEKKYKLAAEKLDQVLYSDPEFVEARFLLARTYEQINGKHLMAIDEAKKVLEKQANNYKVHNLLARIYIFKTSEYEKALAELKETMALAPLDAEARDLLGIMYYLDGNISQAINEHRAALSAQSEYAPAHNHLGDAYRQLKRWADAILEYEAAKSYDKNNLEYIQDLAYTYENAGHKDAAIREWKSFLRQKNISPNQETTAKQRIEGLNKLVF